jgi:hypothetical protein
LELGCVTDSTTLFVVVVVVVVCFIATTTRELGLISDIAQRAITIEPTTTTNRRSFVSESTRAIITTT